MRIIKKFELGKKVSINNMAKIEGIIETTEINITKGFLISMYGSIFITLYLIV